MFCADSNQFPSEWLSRMLPLSYTRQHNNISNTTHSIDEDTCYCITGPARPTFINLSATVRTILVGGHDDFCLAFYINSSSMGEDGGGGGSFSEHKQWQSVPDARILCYSSTTQGYIQYTYTVHSLSSKHLVVPI